MRAPTWEELEAACAAEYRGKRLYLEIRERVARQRVDVALENLRIAAQAPPGEDRVTLLGRMARFERNQALLDAANANWERELQALREAAQ